MPFFSYRLCKKCYNLKCPHSNSNTKNKNIPNNSGDDNDSSKNYELLIYYSFL